MLVFVVLGFLIGFNWFGVKLEVFELSVEVGEFLRDYWEFYLLGCFFVMGRLVRGSDVVYCFFL